MDPTNVSEFPTIILVAYWTMHQLLRRLQLKLQPLLCNNTVFVLSQGGYPVPQSKKHLSFSYECWRLLRCLHFHKTSQAGGTKALMKLCVRLDLVNPVYCWCYLENSVSWVRLAVLPQSKADLLAAQNQPDLSHSQSPMFYSPCPGLTGYFVQNTSLGPFQETVGSRSQTCNTLYSDAPY